MNVIYVDDEKLQHTNFRLSIEESTRVDSLETFDSSVEALKWVETHPVDVAFLDIEMPVMNGIELAKRIKKEDENIRIIFVTAYEQYALQAFGVDAIGYLLKPYSGEDIEKQLRKASYIREIPKVQIRIQTMPDFLVEVDGKPLMLGRTKQEELLALLVDRGEVGINKQDAIDSLWQGYSSDSIYWTTASRLKKILEDAGISNLILTKGQVKYINTEIVECDLYRMQAKDAAAIRNYQGKYLEKYRDQFEWVQRRWEQLEEIKRSVR